MKTFNTLLLFVAALAFSASDLLAQRAIIPESTVSSEPPSFFVNVSVDHENCIYEEGDSMEITVTSSKSGYLYLLYRDASNNVIVLFPNEFYQNNYIKANERVKIPGANMDFRLKTRPPFGRETLQAFVTLKEQTEIQNLMNSRNGQTFKVMNSRDLKRFSKGLGGGRGIEVVGINQEEGSSIGGSSIEKAEYSMEIITVPRGQVPQTNKKRIFVGVCLARYSDSTIPSLPACEKDIEAIGRFFNSSSAVDADDSLVYINEDATKDKIYDLFFNYLPNHTNPGDEIIIYWTGHGGRCSDTNGDERDGYDESLILYDSKKHDPKTQLLDDDFGRWVQNLSGRKVLFILDACHSSGMGNRAKSLNSRKESVDSDWDFGFGECAKMKDLGQSNLALIASCAKSEVSLVRDEQDMSVMTWYMIKCLKKGSRIDHTQLYNAVKEPVHDYVKKVYDVEQNVVIQDDLSAPMILNP